MSNERIRIDNISLIIPAEELKKIIIKNYEELTSVISNQEKRIRHLQKRLDEEKVIY